MSVDETVVIVGAGLAGVQVACALRTEAFAGRIVLIGDEPHAPYHRPPLSKKALAADAAPETIRPSDFLASQSIEAMFGANVMVLDVEDRTVELTDGNLISWDHVVLATGASPRRLPQVPMVAGVHELRSFGDAQRLWAEAPGHSHVAVIGAGFVGLEFAAAVNAMGMDVSVIETAERVMQRAVSPAVSSFVSAAHVAAGIDLRMQTSVTGSVVDGGSVRGLGLSDGSTLAADLVLVAIGARPNTDLAAAAGLAVADGVLVDECMRSSVSGVLAIGDCSRWRVDTGTRRLESVQNATDQAVVAARDDRRSTRRVRRRPVVLERSGRPATADGRDRRGGRRSAADRRCRLAGRDPPSRSDPAVRRDRQSAR